MLALVTEAYGGRGGIARYNRDLFETICSVDPTWSINILPRLTSDLGEAPVGAIRQARAHFGKLRYSLATVSAVFGQRVDLVFCGHLYMAPLAAFIAQLKRAKLVIQTHGIEAWTRPSSLTRRAVETAHIILSVSRHTRSWVLTWAAITPERVFVVPNTVGDEFSPGEGITLRSTLGLGNKKVLLTVGRLDSRERYKGHDRVIASLPALLASGHDVVYLIAGDGDDRARLKQLAHKYGAESRVVFLGELDRRQLIAAYRTADLFVMPSTSEGFGIAFLEAMASGTPALGLCLAGARDALGDGQLGVAATEENFLRSLQTMLEAPPHDREELSVRVRTRFGRAAHAENVRALLHRVMATPMAVCDSPDGTALSPP